MGMRWLRVTWILALALATLPSSAGEDPWAASEARGERIGALRIVTSDVFDLRKPDENYWLARAANFLHITTRERIIREALLFKLGDRVDAATIHETERLLRALPWVQDATIEPLPAGPGSVRWSLSPAVRRAAGACRRATAPYSSGSEPRA